MKSILSVVFCLCVSQIMADVQLLEEQALVQKKQTQPQHPFYKQAQNLGKRALENLYEGEKITHFSFGISGQEDLATQKSPDNNATFRFDFKDQKEQVVTKKSVNYQDEKGRTALHWAAFVGSLEAVKALLEQGADVNLTDSLGWTPLHCAAVQGHAGIVSYLIERGADRTARTKKTGATAYWLASIGDGHPQVLRALEGGYNQVAGAHPLHVDFLKRSPK